MSDPKHTNFIFKNALYPILLTIVLVAGCGFPGVYRIDIQQGNQITQEMVDQLKPGMTDKQVRFILGTPLVRDSFHPDRWDYVYRLDKPNEPLIKKRLTVFFEDRTLTHFVVDIPKEDKEQIEDMGAEGALDEPR